MDTVEHGEGSAPPRVTPQDDVPPVVPLDGAQAAEDLRANARRQVSRRPVGEALEGRRAASGGLVAGP
ncbi:hypothetical protein ACIQVR_42155, partial [Streptomyces xanthochromogenes]|uniref:hypothetical protein n=1 Tax=Streptomyces xanthochromogenes TaxID=67384 RepID=UPI0038222916